MCSRNKKQVSRPVCEKQLRGKGRMGEEGSGSGASSLLTTLMSLSVWKLLSGCLCVGVEASGSRL